MSTAVSSFITRIICQNLGCMDYKQLDQTLRKNVTISESILHKVLRDADKFIIIEGKEKRLTANSVSADSWIIAKTSLRVCKKLPDNCTNCGDLHLCRYLVCGSCKYGTKCKNSHDVNSDYNRAVRANHGLHELEAAELFTLLLQNDPSLLPEVCSHYNKGNGDHGSCKYKGSCKNLHVCLHFLQGDCTFGGRCKRAHAFDGGAAEVLQRRGASAGDARGLRRTYGNALAIAGRQSGHAGLGSLTAGLCIAGGGAECAPPPTARAPAPPTPAARERPRQLSASEAETNDICLYFLRRHCSFKEKCLRVHYHLPYRWQVSEEDGTIWKDLPDMEDIEQAYCNPGNDTSKGVSRVDFLTMTCGSSKVRRLSSASSVTKPPHFILTTDWLWYRKNDRGEWLEFGSEAEGDGSSIASQTLENIYLADTSGEIPFSSEGQHYILNFKDMVQRNVVFETERVVRRRPLFISAKGVEKKLKSITPEASASSAASIPEHWDQEALPDFDYKLIRLSASSMEFQQLQKLFRRTMPSSTVHSIQRIQNPSLLRVFQWQKERMKKQNGGRPVDQRLLFHGTEGSLIPAICEQNFDWRICGIHGSHYGRGSYFARDASYSDRFSKSGGGPKTMFAVQVLVGEFTRGHRSYLRPPQKGQSQSFYDSCVDSVDNPAIFVIFEKHQIYPEYVIEYGA